MSGIEKFSDGRVVAFMDIGTNSMRLLMVRVKSNHSYATLTQQKEMVRLGEGEFVDHYLQPEAMDRAVDQSEIAMMATTGLFHRRAMPTKKHPEMKELNKQARQAVKTMCVLVRLGEELDRSHTGVVEHAKLRAANRTHAILEIRAVQDCQLELWGVQDRLKAAEKILGREIQIKMVGQKTKNKTTKSLPAPPVAG
ncbi:MAG TPA: hypothetical protein VMV04_07990 [Thermodesulfobacteriota bacterium]|nr:hypothetical protein [Thermodesulfobacteriota bacterium]